MRKIIRPQKSGRPPVVGKVLKAPKAAVIGRSTLARPKGLPKPR